MKNRSHALPLAALSLLCCCLLWTPAPAQEGPPGGPGFGEPPPFGPDGPGPGGFGGMMQPEVKLTKQFDKDGNGWLNAAERKAAREFLQKERAEGRGPRGFGGRGGRGGPGGPGFGGPRGNQEPPKPGVKLIPADVKSFPDAPLYDAQTLRTFFLEFENADWEKE